MFRRKILTTIILLGTGAVIGCGGQAAAPTQNQTSSKTAESATENRSMKADRSAVSPNNDLPPKQPSEPAPVFRPEDTRPRHDDAALEEIGIRSFESKRLKLYTDIAPELARPLPGLMDQAYEAWEEYFGPLPPNRAGTAYQMTGYIMTDRRLFLEAGLLPEDLVGFLHGRHRGAEFWMNDQEHDYYRRHLTIHEGTHCFMTTMPGVMAPTWYMEGMAELFGTHHLDKDGKATFRVMPKRSLDVRSWGRLQIIANERKAGRLRSLTDIFSLQHNDFLKVEAYAWSWALCKFLDTHPRYRQRFRELGGYLEGRAFVAKFQELYRNDQRDLNREWTLFAAGFNYGFDFERAVVEFTAGQELKLGSEAVCEIAAGKGWQSSDTILKEGETYRILATGRVVVANVPQPWSVEADGVTIRYHAGRPLGMLVATVLGPDAVKVATVAVTPIGREAEFIAPHDGTLFFRVNDYWSELADNSGAFRVQTKR